MEEQFFNSLYEELDVSQNCCIHLYRMSNGTISVYYKTFPVGKIKLQGKKHWMQILKGIYTHKTVEGDISVFIRHIVDWERYIRLHCK